MHDNGNYDVGVGNIVGPNSINELLMLFCWTSFITSDCSILFAYSKM